MLIVIPLYDTWVMLDFKRGKILWRKGGVLTKRELLQQLKGFVG